jgi:hypothetical protein
MIEEVKKHRRFNWWWLLLIASSALFKYSNSGWITQSQTMNKGVAIGYDVGEVIGTMILGLALPLLFTLCMMMFKGRGVWTKDKHTFVRTAAILMTVLAGLMFVSYRGNHFSAG